MHITFYTISAIISAFNTGKTVTGIPVILAVFLILGSILVSVSDIVFFLIFIIHSYIFKTEITTLNKGDIHRYSINTS